jgi:hypothetical protein
MAKGIVEQNCSLHDASKLRKIEGELPFKDLPFVTYISLTRFTFKWSIQL